MRQSLNHSTGWLEANWRHLLMAAIVVGSLIAMFSLDPLAQPLEYHNFADRREFFGIPNFFDVASNLPFLFVGIAGLGICVANRLGEMRAAWIILFAGIALVSAGSAYYHWNPNSETLVWDRLPMTIGFMGLFAALLGEYVSERVGKILLVPALLLGAFSVFYWSRSDDLRLYIWVQLIPLLTIPIVMILYRARFSRAWMLLAALAFYAMAKLTELGDVKIFESSQNIISGHTIKHLLSAIGCLIILVMLRSRRPLESA